MERLTNKREAWAQRKDYENRIANGYPRNIPEERFLRLAAYEDTGLTPEEIAARRWISVTERLPDKWENEETGALANYLIHGQHFDVDIGYYHAKEKCWFCRGLPLTVTHWMPLPKAPEVE